MLRGTFLVIITSKKRTIIPRKKQANFCNNRAILCYDWNYFTSSVAKSKTVSPIFDNFVILSC